MTTQEQFNQTKRTDIYNIDPRNIVVMSGFNMRQDFGDLSMLAKSISENGMLNPITVMPFKNENGEEKYHLIDGERRFRATMIAINEGADIARVKAIYVPKNTSEQDLYLQQYVRNEGKPFTDMENAEMFSKFVNKYGYTQAEVASKFGKNQAYVSKMLSLLELPQDIQSRLRNNEIAVEAALNITKTIVNEAEAVQAVEAAVSEAKAKGKTKATAKNITSVEVKDKNDSKVIFKGLDLLINMLVERRIEEFDAILILAELKEGKTISDILSDMTNVKSNLTKEEAMQKECK